MIIFLTAHDLIFLLHRTAALYVEVIHGDIDTGPECISPPAAYVKLPFM